MEDGHIPTMTTDGLRVYTEAIEERFFVLREWFDSIRKRMYYEMVPPEKLRYGQVIKQMRNGKLEVVEYREVFGHVPPQDFNTSFIERLNLTIRSDMARMIRRTIKFSKKADMLQNSFDLVRANYNLCRPHMSLNVCRKNNGGVFKRVTPGMSQGVTDHVWSMREMMSFPLWQNMHYKL